MAEEVKSGTLNCGNCNYLDGDKKTLNCEGCAMSLNKDSGSASSSSDDNNDLAIAYLNNREGNILVNAKYLSNVKDLPDNNDFYAFIKDDPNNNEPYKYKNTDEYFSNKYIQKNKDSLESLLTSEDGFVMVDNNKTNIKVEIKGGSRKPKKKTKKRKTKKRKTKRRTNKKRYRHL